jgi:hypothetical protein
MERGRKTDKTMDNVAKHDFLGKCDNCGACCTFISINSTLPNGVKFRKPAGTRCEYLTKDSLCEVWGDKKRQPSVCRNILPFNSLCRFDLRNVPSGKDSHAQYLRKLEKLTLSNGIK